MFGIDKYGKRIKITARLSVAGHSFQSITLESMDDLKLLPLVQGRLMFRSVYQNPPKSTTFQIKAFSAESFEKDLFSHLKKFPLN